MSRVASTFGRFAAACGSSEGMNELILYLSGIIAD